MKIPCVLRRLGGACLTLILSAAASAAPVVELPADPPARRTAALEEIWRVGGEDDEDILLGLVSSGVLDDAGNAYLMDRQLSQVLVISLDGELVRTIGREGDGPGEFRRAGGVFLTATAVGVVQSFPGRIVLNDYEGTPAGEIAMGGDAQDGGFRFLQRLVCNGEHMVGQSGRATFDREAGRTEVTVSLVVMDLEGNVQADFAPHTSVRELQRPVFDEAANFAEHNAWALAPGGPLYTLGTRDEYRINVRDLAGNLLSELIRPFTPRRRDQEDKDRLVANMRFGPRRRSVEVENKALDTDPAILSLDAAADGRLFVTNCHGHGRHLAADGVVRYDILGTEGTFQEELTLTFPGYDAEDDGVVFLDGEHFLIVLNQGPAREAFTAGFGGGGDQEDDVDPGDAEPLEVVLVRVAR